MLLFGPDWHELPDQVIEFRSENGESLSLIPTEVLSPHVMDYGVMKLDVELRLETWGDSVVARSKVFSYGGMQELLRLLQSIRSGQSQKELVFQWENIELFVEVRRERVRPRYWVTGSVGHRPSQFETSVWLTNFGFEWAFVDSPYPVDQAIAQLEKLVETLRSRGYNC